jgi:hypothetical protein
MNNLAFWQLQDFKAKTERQIQGILDDIKKLQKKIAVLEGEKKTKGRKMKPTDHYRIVNWMDEFIVQREHTGMFGRRFWINEYMEIPDFEFSYHGDASFTKLEDAEKWLVCEREKVMYARKINREAEIRDATLRAKGMTVVKEYGK